MKPPSLAVPGDRALRKRAQPEAASASTKIMAAPKRSVALASLPHSTTPRIDPCRAEKHLPIHEAQFRGAGFRPTPMR
jgi:hypothetical protein